uniref:Helicase ATP-binding domain-containing protein n=1 Tax=viral metagenome TaxID=1070528 RepID=A0A6C0D4H5_9ZZZZ
MVEESKEDSKTVEHLENLIKEENIMSFDSDCIRKKSNWSKSSKHYKFDNPSFQPETLLNDIPTHSPKLDALLKKIDELDKADKKKHGKLFKHFIFSDLKSNTYGTKLLAAAFMAKGLTMGYGATLIKPISKASSRSSSRSSASTSKSESESDSDDDSVVTKGGNPKPPKKEKLYNKMELLSDEQLKRTKNENFYLLSSVSVYDQNITVAHKKEILKKFNQRPENIHGELVRFIIMDSGFKEGIDLFDIKYIHIFEPSTVASDQKQTIGRGTRTCGQKGLEFHPKSGWPLHVFIYDLSIPQELRSTFLGSVSAMDLYLKTMNIDVRLFHFAHDLEKTTVFGSVDYELNKNIHSFSIPNSLSDDEGGDEFVYGGGEENEFESDGLQPIQGGGPKVTQKRLRIRADATPIIINTSSEKPKTHEEMRDFIREHYSEFTWPLVKMENLCEDKEKKGGANQSAYANQTASASQVMKYTPTQDFIRHYFTPTNPLKGILLYQGVGTGKTCCAIAAATTTFEKDGYTIIWVTRTTLKNDIWKNMFDQVCNESISHRITNEGLEIPNEQNKRMRLLSKAWRIRPMSYKQFSNLVSKQNAFYKTLVKINGQVDPLRKTLLIIDEAHKLYGGTDLSSLERPDMNALHQALMHSYQLSGRDSAKLILMTATPVTQDPMELIKLINLCKPIDRQIPDRFEEFSEKYLNEMGEFTEQGRHQYLDDIAGHVSYLNREKDARQFAQPIIKHINVPIVDKEGFDAAKKFDRKIVRDIMESDVSDLMAKIAEKSNELVGELSDIDASKFSFLKEEICDGLSGKELKAAEKVANANIRDLVTEAKDHVKQIRKDIKELREAMKERNKGRKDAIAAISGNRENLEEEYEDYKGSLLYSMKNKCSTKVLGNAPLREQIKEHPEVAQIDRDMEEKNTHIRELQERLKVQIALYKTRITYLRSLLKTDLTVEEKTLLRTNIKSETKYYRKIIVSKRKYNKKIESNMKKEIKKLEKTRKKKYNSVKKTVKNQIRDEKKKKTAIKREEANLRKTLRKQGELKEEIHHDLLKNLTQKYRAKIMEDMVDYDEKMVEEEREKAEAKEKKAKEKERIKQENARERLAERERVRQEKEALRKTKKAEKEKERAEKEATRKNQRKQPK